MALGDAADGGVAGHLRDEVKVKREQSGAQAHAGRGHGRFAAGVSGADDDYIVLFCEWHTGNVTFVFYCNGHRPGTPPPGQRRRFVYFQGLSGGSSPAKQMILQGLMAF